MLCDYCKRQCSNIVSLKNFCCSNYQPPKVSLSVGDVVWGKLYEYDVHSRKRVPSPQEFKVVSLNRNVIRCYSDTTGVAHAFEYLEYGDRFFLTKKELLSAYEFDNELR